MFLKIAAHSEVGLVRKNNQDSGYFSPTMLLVCDGMGGAAAGDLASSVAAQRLADVDGPYAGEAMLDVLSETLTDANHVLRDLVTDNPDLEGMGTTVCGALFDGTHLGVIHVGDSRGYIYRDGVLNRMTHDHSWVQSLIDEGKITELDAASHPHRSLLLKVLNGSPQHTPDRGLIEVCPGDRILFCSDGLCGMIDDTAIASRMVEENLEDVVDALTEAAHEAGGLDNITIVLADVVEEAPEPTPEPTLIGAAAVVVVPEVTVSDDTAGDDEIPAIAEAPKPAQQPKPKKKSHRAAKWLISLIVLALLAAGGAVGAKYYLRTQFYLAERNGTVAIYKGLPEKLGPLPLHTLTNGDTNIHVADLPTSYQAKLAHHEWQGETITQAYETLGQLDAAAQQCVARREARYKDPTLGPAVDGC